MKILQIGPFPLTSSCISGGVESSIYGLSVELSRKHNVVAVDFPRVETDTHSETVDGVKVWRLARSGVSNLSALRCLKQVQEIITEERPDVCHIHGTGVFSYKIYQAIPDSRKILTVHGVVYEEKLKALRRHFSFRTFSQFIYQSYYERRFLSICNDIIADTEYVKREIGGMNLAAMPAVHVIPQGISQTYFEIDHADTGMHKTVLSVGSICERKGHLQLMEAFETVWKKDKNVRLIIAGSLSSRSYYKKMLDLKKSLVSSDAICIKTNISQTELLDLYKSASVFALHSQEESQGIVFAEAMACGLPIVATNVGGIPFVVNNGVNGLLSDFGRCEAFADNLNRLLQCDELRKPFGIEGHKAADDYLWSSIAGRVFDIYKKL